MPTASESPTSTTRVGRGRAVAAGSASVAPAGGSGRRAGALTATRTRSTADELAVEASMTVRAANALSSARQRPLPLARAIAWQPALKQPADSRTVVPALARPATASGRPAFTRAPGLGAVMVMVVCTGRGVGVAAARGAGLSVA